VQHINTFLKLGDINDAKGARPILNPNLINRLSNCDHGLKVIWLKALLNPVDLITGLAFSLLWESP
jgi:hypothetical protein